MQWETGFGGKFCKDGGQKTYSSINKYFASKVAKYFASKGHTFVWYA
jgi:hypothetical protein